MSDEIVRAKQRALEEKFMARQDEAVMKKVAAPEKTTAAGKGAPADSPWSGKGAPADAAWAGRQAMTRASGIADEAALEQLQEMRLGPEGVAALALVPLVLVAWADGELTEDERKAIQAASLTFGLAEQLLAQQLLAAWLAAPPGKELAQAWRDYVSTVAPKLNGEGRAAVKQQTVGRARAIAEAAGGFLGIGKISAAEQAVLADLEAAFGM